MNIDKNEVNDPTENQVVLANVVFPILKKDDVDSVRIYKKFFDLFEYRTAKGYKAFLAWALDIGKYFQGDLAVWHWADVCRLFRNYDYNNEVVLIIQNTEYVIVGTENISDQTIKFLKMRLEDVYEALDKKSPSVSKVGDLV